MIPLTFNWKHGLIAGIIFIAFSAGWTVNGWRNDAAIKNALQETIELQQAYDKYARESVKKFQSQQANQVIVYRDLKGKIKDVTDNRVCFADNNALSLWNNALTGMSDSPTRVAKTTTSTGTATDTAILSNAIENFEQSKQVRDQLNALIDWYENNK